MRVLKFFNFYDQHENLTSMKVFLAVSDEALLREYASGSR